MTKTYYVTALIVAAAALTGCASHPGTGSSTVADHGFMSEVRASGFEATRGNVLAAGAPHADSEAPVAAKNDAP